VRPLVLAIDDEAAILDVVEYALHEHGFEVARAEDGPTGWRLFETRRPALVLLDLNLPGRDGLSLFRAMRAARPDAPVIMATSRTADVDRILGLELGADDYVTKPFHPRELVARVKAVLRRAERPEPGRRHTHGPFQIDADAWSLTYYGQALALTRGEFLLLAALIRHPARTFDRESLLRVMHEVDPAGSDRSVDAAVKRLRRKLQAVRPDEDPIETLYGLGYKLRRIEG
jgi:DNA-binding response OmpR family regulator